MQRRKLLKLGIASSAVLLVAGGAAALIQPGWSQGKLTAAGHAVFAAAGRAVLAGTLPLDAAPRQAAIDGMLSRIDILIQALPPHAQDELSQLLAVLASSAGRRAFAGLATPWLDASDAEITAAMQGMRLSSLAAQQQAYAALHDIAASAYFSDPATWSVLGYPGPMKI